MKQNKKGFTLIELLVAILIIGILAAIALPQYHLAVDKAKFSNLKQIVASLTGSIQSYYLTHNTYPKKMSDFDVEYDIISETTGSLGLTFTLNNGTVCNWYYNHSTGRALACALVLAGKNVLYERYINHTKLVWDACTVYSDNTTDRGHRLCQAETGRALDGAYTQGGGWYRYNY